MYDGVSWGIFEESSAGETLEDEEERMSISVERSMDCKHNSISTHDVRNKSLGGLPAVQPRPRLLHS